MGRYFGTYPTHPAHVNVRRKDKEDVFSGNVGRSALKNMIADPVNIHADVIPLSQLRLWQRVQSLQRIQRYKRESNHFCKLVYPLERHTHEEPPEHSTIQSIKRSFVKLFSRYVPDVYKAHCVTIQSFLDEEVYTKLLQRSQKTLLPYIYTQDDIFLNAVLSLTKQRSFVRGLEKDTHTEYAGSYQKPMAAPHRSAPSSASSFVSSNTLFIIREEKNTKATARGAYSLCAYFKGMFVLKRTLQGDYNDLIEHIENSRAYLTRLPIYSDDHTPPPVDVFLFSNHHKKIRTEHGVRLYKVPYDLQAILTSYTQDKTFLKPFSVPFALSFSRCTARLKHTFAFIGMPLCFIILSMLMIVYGTYQDDFLQNERYALKQAETRPKNYGTWRALNSIKTLPKASVVFKKLVRVPMHQRLDVCGLTLDQSSKTAAKPLMYKVHLAFATPVKKNTEKLLQTLTKDDLSLFKGSDVSFVWSPNTWSLGPHEPQRPKNTEAAFASHDA